LAAVDLRDNFTFFIIQKVIAKKSTMLLKIPETCSGARVELVVVEDEVEQYSGQ
jgi:hypothetical protein